MLHRPDDDVSRLVLVGGIAIVAGSAHARIVASLRRSRPSSSPRGRLLYEVQVGVEISPPMSEANGSGGAKIENSGMDGFSDNGCMWRMGTVAATNFHSN